MSCRKGMRGCRPSCGHKQLVEAYRSARHSAVLQREYETSDYDEEKKNYGPIITFKEWLQQMSSERDSFY